MKDWISVLPTVNASLNATAGACLLAGYVFIKRKQVAAHRAAMVAAVTASTLFLCSYLLYHFKAGSTPFTGEGRVRIVYFAILLTHTVLAMVVAPMAVVTFYRGLKGQVESHRKIARKTFPIWIYVSVTGVLIYLMLYHFYGAAV